MLGRATSCPHHISMCLGATFQASINAAWLLNKVPDFILSPCYMQTERQAS